MEGTAGHRCVALLGGTGGHCWAHVGALLSTGGALLGTGWWNWWALICGTDVALMGTGTWH
ncbi:unnamed protein product [Staurois parvus]|uniref:Uncharacterized protein n=1 Tax=Staurois parvus TaxID=386267 RepID=A0ABN9CSG5_9NEOB|nr:unnamed protein product [Staurois parvus]